jgi:phosphoadenosine phosphosulfate reductase
MGLTDAMEQKAIEYIKNFEPRDGYVVGFSGGKDSIVVRDLAIRSGVKHQCVYNNTTVDPPELVAFVRSFEDVKFVNPRRTMRQLIITNGMPTQLYRFCCQELKERTSPGKLTITGVRWFESVKRKKTQGVVNVYGKTKAEGVVYNDDNAESRRVVEHCYRTNKVLINPIIDWTDDDVWEYIHKHSLRYCHLYDEGFDRLGCIGCPMGSSFMRRKSFERWPRYKLYYLNAFRDYIKRRKDKGNYKDELPQTAQEMFDKWESIIKGRSKQ